MLADSYFLVQNVLLNYNWLNFGHFKSDFPPYLIAALSSTRFFYSTIFRWSCKLLTISLQFNKFFCIYWKQWSRLSQNFNCLMRWLKTFFAGDEYRVIVENLSSQTRRQDLKNYMSKAGEVIYAHKTSSCEGCVAFASEKVNYMVIINCFFQNHEMIWVPL